MDGKDFALAVIPPGLAIFMELLTPLTARFFSRQAERIVNDEIGPASSVLSPGETTQLKHTLGLLLESSMAGASSLAGLAPTVVSFITSGVAIVSGIQNQFWWILGFIVASIILIVLFLRMISGQSLYELQTKNISATSLTATGIFTIFIYITNILLIFTAIIVYALAL